MTHAAELEIALHRRDASSHAVELRFSQPDSDADVRLQPGGASPVSLDLARLRQAEMDPAEYGALLGDMLLAEAEVRAAFDKALTTAQALDAPLRLRLFVGPSAPELHAVRWETLRLPGATSPLVTGQRVLFSRYLSSFDWRPVRLRPRADLRALVIIANPTGLSKYQPGGAPLQPVDVEGELARAKAGLGALAVTALASAGSATLPRLAAALRDGHDILYLVAHGALIDGEPWLWLEDEAGNVQLAEGRELVTQLAELQQAPRLVVLASCQSAGAGGATAHDGGALAALGPRLAEAGIPAVIGMQGNVAMETVAAFMPVLFAELARDGQVDRAVSAARGAVRDKPDWWMPALFMRLKSGRIWYAPGFGGEAAGLEKWPALQCNVEAGRCTPILGSGLTESLCGSYRDIARAWAERYGFPMEASDCESLPRVAQYLAVHQEFRFPRDELAASLRNEILRRWGSELPEDVRSQPLPVMRSAAGARQRERDPAEPHRVLAELPLPIYVTTQPDNLLGDALVAAGRQPRVEICRWNAELEQLPSIYDTEPDYRPTPLVYHLFGHEREPDSIVLTEDDYFDFLIGVTRNEDLIPGVVRRAFADTALLLLGFQLDDWDFRVLFRTIMGQEGRGRRRRYAHVAAQVDPEQGRTLEPARARKYLEERLQVADISIFWGTVEDFMRELKRRVAQ